MAQLTREQVLGADDLAKQVVEVPEWGGSVTIATMSGEARDAWEQSLVAEPGVVGGKVDLHNTRARLLAYTAVNDNGERMFSNADAELLGRKSSKALDRCVKVARKLNGLLQKDIDELVKN